MYWSDYENLRIDKAKQGIHIPSIEGVVMEALANDTKLFQEQLVHFVSAHTAIFPWEVNARIHEVLQKLSNECKIARDYETKCWYRC